MKKTNSKNKSAVALLNIAVFFVTSLVFATSEVNFTFEGKTTRFGCEKLLGSLNRVYPQEMSDCAHKQRLAQSLMNKWKIRRTLQVKFYLPDGGNPRSFTEIKYGKVKKQMPKYLRDDISFTGVLLAIWGRRENAKGILGSLVDKSAPAISPSGEMIAYRLWQKGKVGIKVEDLKGRTIWRFWADRASGLGDPLWSPESSGIYFLSYKYYKFIHVEKVSTKTLSKYECESPSCNYIYFKDLAAKRFFKWKPPSPPSKCIQVGEPFIYPSSKFLAYGTLVDGMLKLYFIKGGKVVYASECPCSYYSKSEILWSPNQSMLAVMTYKLIEGLTLAREGIFIIDVLAKKSSRFNLPPGLYSFVWDRNSRGVYLVTKEKRRGEIFYLDIKKKKIRKVYRSKGSLEPILVQKDGKLLLRLGENKLLMFVKGRANVKPAKFIKYNINQKSMCFYREEVYELPIVSAFPENRLKLIVTDEVAPQAHTKFKFEDRDSFIMIGKERCLILSKHLFQQVEKALKERRLVYLDIDLRRGIFGLRSPEGGCTQSVYIPFY